MEWVVRDIRTTVSVTLGIIVSLLLAIGMRTSFFTHCFIPAHKLLSLSENRIVEHSINEYMSKKTVGSKSLFSYIRQRYPFINSCSFAYGADGMVRIGIDVYEPQFLVNNEAVLVRGGLLFEKHIFDSNSLFFLPQIQIPAHRFFEVAPLVEGGAVVYHSSLCGALADKGYRFLKSLPQDLFEQYTVERLSAVETILRDIKKGNFSVVINDDMVITQEFLDQITCLKRSVDDKEVSTGAQKRYWVADARFSNQIVLSPLKKEACSDKNIS